jgi:hypothetical protein
MGLLLQTRLLLAKNLIVIQVSLFKPVVEVRAQCICNSRVRVNQETSFIWSRDYNYRAPDGSFQNVVLMGPFCRLRRRFAT